MRKMFRFLTDGVIKPLKVKHTARTYRERFPYQQSTNRGAYIKGSPHESPVRSKCSINLGGNVFGLSPCLEQLCWGLSKFFGIQMDEIIFLEVIFLSRSLRMLTSICFFGEGVGKARSRKCEIRVVLPDGMEFRRDGLVGQNNKT
ncbi:hypothetical protein TNCT_239131 [Trichonephila clavata]|uniref:Uncharacterized protein n=1 Tax=Trichonephila clavata TaxID=2740835 RepID=A0A8X6JW17_TRICU|nr:hypothetical protein TNCT_239131 [Trichonephila clavata]